jgi:hypothetical protein
VSISLSPPRLTLLIIRRQGFRSVFQAARAAVATRSDRSIVVVGNYKQWPDSGGTMPSESLPFTPSSILFRPRSLSGLFRQPFIAIAGQADEPHTWNPIYRGPDQTRRLCANLGDDRSGVSGRYSESRLADLRKACDPSGPHPHKTPTSGNHAPDPGAP